MGTGRSFQAQPLVETGDAMDMAFAVDAGEHRDITVRFSSTHPGPAASLGAIRQHAHGAVGAAHHVNRVQNQFVLTRQLYAALAGAQEAAVENRASAAARRGAAVCAAP